MGIWKVVMGAMWIASGILIDMYLPGGEAIGNALIAAGAGTVFSGVGTLLQSDQHAGFFTTTRNPTAPWKVIYGRTRSAGVLVQGQSWE